MADSLGGGLGDLGGSSGGLGDMGKGLGGGLSGLGGGLGGHHYLKWILIGSSIIGILSAVFIFILILSIDLGFKLPIELETFGIIAGLCAFITGIDTLWNTFKKSSGGLGGL
jgi:hypothetical protein